MAMPRWNKAKFQGTCQVCGSLQKLPAGKLAKHGYTTRWGFFEGTCFGSGHLPFEVSTDLIDRAIQQAHQQAGKMVDEAVALETPTQTPEAWVREHAGYLKRHAIYRWRKVALILLGGTDSAYSRTRIGYFSKDYHHKAGQFQTVSPMGGADIQAQVFSAANRLNLDRADFLRAEVKKCLQYAQWQQDRIDHWRPTELVPVKEVA